MLQVVRNQKVRQSCPGHQFPPVQSAGGEYEAVIPNEVMSFGSMRRSEPGRQEKTMLLTEEEARKKVCRQELVTIRDTYEAWHLYCIASECMMWRWDEEEREFLGADLPKTAPYYWDSGIGQYFRFTGKFTKGYCGLAGKP